MKKQSLILSILLFALFTANAQIGIGTSTPDASAKLDVTSTNKGFLPPRVTAAQKTAIATPATGLLIFQTDTPAGYYYYNGSVWILLTTTLTGPVTSVGNQTTITDKAVTLAKMNDMATGSLIYRKTALAGVPETQTLATLKTDLGLSGINTGDHTESYIYIRDEKSVGTWSGGFTSGAWRTRTLNTIVVNTGSLATLVGTTGFNLPAGTYRFRASAPGFDVGRHQARLFVTEGTQYFAGTSEFSVYLTPTGASNKSIVSGRFTIAGTSLIQLQHQCDITNSSNGYGVNANFSTEVYSEIELWKEQ